MNLDRFRIRTVWSILAALVCAVLVSGCQTTSSDAEPVAAAGSVKTASNEAAAAKSASSLGMDYLRAGDRIRIVFADIPDAPAATDDQIPEDGKLTLHKNVEIYLLGKKRTDLEKEIEDIYVKQRKLYNRIKVTIERLGLFISVGGEVRTPSGTVPFTAGMTLTTAINASGGCTEFANRRQVLIKRANGETLKVNLRKAVDDPKFDIPLYPGDTVHVHRTLL